VAVLLVVLAVVAVVVIALVTVGDVVAKLSRQPPLRVFDLEEAVTWVAERLPEPVTAQLSFTDVSAVIAHQLDFFEAKGVARDASVPDPKDGVEASGVPGPAQVVDEDDALAFVLGRIADADGLPDAGDDFDDAYIVHVLESTDAYLMAIGAVGAVVIGPTDPLV